MWNGKLAIVRFYDFKGEGINYMHQNVANAIFDVLQEQILHSTIS